MRAKGWCFTQYLEPEDDLACAEQVYRELFKAPDWAIMQVERCPTTERLHIQGYAYFQSGVRSFASVKQFLMINPEKLPHISIANGSPKQNEAYCTKADTRVAGPWYINREPDAGGQGKRNDIHKQVAYLKEVVDLTTENDDLFMDENCVSLAVKYPQAFDRIVNRLKRAKQVWAAPLMDLRPWQTIVMGWIRDLAPQEPERPASWNPRHVRWLVDGVGGTGKSTFANWLDQRPDCHAMTCAANTDLASLTMAWASLCATNKINTVRVVVLDIPRSGAHNHFYQFIELLQSGVMLSNKYQSQQLRFRPVRVLVFSNHAAILNMLSEDRLQSSHYEINSAHQVARTVWPPRVAPPPMQVRWHPQE